MNKKQFNDGVYDISNEMYHGSQGISRSQLMLLDKSPYHFWYEVLSGHAEKKESTPAMNVGSAFHTLLLEPEKFNDEFAVSPKVDRRTVVGKELFAKFTDEHGHKIILTQEQFEQTSIMVDNILKHEVVKTLLDEAVFEQSVYWTDEETGLQFKTRPDIWASKMVVDIKTTSDTNVHTFARKALTYGYYLQAGMAFEACKALGKPFDMFVILACEKEAPNVPAVFMMHDDSLQFGVNQFNNYKRKLKECMDSNKWPGYVVQELNVPQYATIDNEE